MVKSSSLNKLSRCIEKLKFIRCQPAAKLLEVSQDCAKAIEDLDKAVKAAKSKLDLELEGSLLELQLNRNIIRSSNVNTNTLE